MYRIIKDQATGNDACIQRTTDGAFIPFDPANTDYQEFLRWCSEGNEALPADSAPADA